MKLIPAVTIAALLSILPASPAAESSRPRPIPDREFGEAPVIWGAECVLPDGSGLAFGGCDMAGKGGPAGTRIREGGAWKPIGEELRRGSPLSTLRERARELSGLAKRCAVRARTSYLEGRPPDRSDLSDLVRVANDLSLRLLAEGRPSGDLASLAEAMEGLRRASEASADPASAVRDLHRAQVDLERAADALDAEPLPRALSPIAHDARTGLFVLFGGDHLDFLLSDTWVFDPRGRKWTRRASAKASPSI